MNIYKITIFVPTWTIKEACEYVRATSIELACHKIRTSYVYSRQFIKIRNVEQV